MAESVKPGVQAPFHGRELLAILLILLLATVLRVGWPTLTEFKFDEARMAALALELTREGHLPLVGMPSSAGFGHSPISVYLYVPAFLLTSNPIPATIYGGLVGVVAVALCWWLARRWPGGDPWAAAIAAVLFAVSPWAVAVGRKIWQITFVPLLSLAFVGLVVSALIGRRRWNLTWALVVYALLVQVHPSAISLTLALVLWLIVFWREVRIGPLLVGLVLGALTALPFVLHQVKSGWPAVAAFTALPEAIWDLSAVRLAWEVITGRGIHALAGKAYPFLRVVPELGWGFNLVGWLTVGAALVLAWRVVAGWRATTAGRRQRARVDLILITSLVVPVVFNLRHSLDLYLHSFALVMPVAYLIVGRGSMALADAIRSGAVKRSVRVGILIAIGLLALGQVIALVLMAQFVATHNTAGGFGTPLRHYMKVADKAVALVREQGASEVLVVSQGDSVVVDKMPAIFDVLFRDQVSYRFVDGASTAVFPPHHAVVLLTPEAGEVADWYEGWPTTEVLAPPDGYRLVALDGSWPQQGLEPITGSRLFANGLEMQGYGWQGDLGPGKLAVFWLLWQVLWQSPEDTHLYVQVTDAEEYQWGQYDTVGYPTAFRRKGDRIVSKFDIMIEPGAPDGPYGARVGVYVFPEVAEVPVVDETGRPVIDVVVIEPEDGGQKGSQP